MARPESMLKPEELRELSIITPWKSWFFICFTWGLIIATFAIPAISTNIFVIIAAMILMARHQLSLAILMHDAAHKRLFKNPKWNDYIGQFFLASPVLFSLMAYRNFHLKHHKDPLVPDDPDISLIGGYPIAQASFYRKLFRDISGQSYLKFIKYFISKSRTEKGRNQKSDGKKVGPNFREVVTMMLVANIIIFTTLWFFGSAWEYLVLWIIPMLTILQVLLRIRGIGEHAGYTPNPDQRLNARTIINPLQTFFFAPNNVNYHIEHHIFPSIPWYNLPRAHKLLLPRDFFPKQNMYTSYGQILKELLQ